MFHKRAQQSDPTMPCPKRERARARIDTLERNFIFYVIIIYFTAILLNQLF